MVKIKICGLLKPQDAIYLNEAKPDYAGLVFDQGRHFLTDEKAAAIREVLDDGIPAVGIFVNEPQDHIVSLVNHGVIQIIQLHGQESEAYITSLREKTGYPGSVCPLNRGYHSGRTYFGRISSFGQWTGRHRKVF